MQKVENIDETPAFAKHVLPAVPSSEVYLEDCVKALKRFNDNHFDLAIVDPPYGLEQVKSHSKVEQEKVTTIPIKIGMLQLQRMNIGMNFLGFLKIKLCGVQITMRINYQ
jgi:16S rRNA G966 N2-methylase RsmD